MSETEIPISEIQLLSSIGGGSSQLGRGSFGNVMKGFWTSKNKLVAVKFVHKSDEPDLQGYNESVKREHLKEIDNFRKLAHHDHNRIVKFYGTTRSKIGVHIVLEFVEGGSLQSIIEKCVRNEVRLDIEKKVRIALDIAEGMEYLHTVVKMVHRDLKPLNVLITRDWRAVLCDFGSARDVQHRTVQTVGTALYFAPELIGMSGERMSSFSSDVYSFGVSLFATFFEKAPSEWPLKTFPKVRKNKRTMKKIVELIKGCVKVKPDERINMETVVEMLEDLMDDLKNTQLRLVQNELGKFKKMCSEKDSSISDLEARLGRCEEEKVEEEKRKKQLEELVVKLQNNVESTKKENRKLNGEKEEQKKSMLEKLRLIRDSKVEAVESRDSAMKELTKLKKTLRLNETQIVELQSMNKDFEKEKKGMQKKMNALLKELEIRRREAGRSLDGDDKGYSSVGPPTNKEKGGGSKDDSKTAFDFHWGLNGVNVDYYKPHEIYEQIVNAGCELDGKSFYILGRSNECGYGVKRDKTKCSEYYKKAAEFYKSKNEDDLQSIDWAVMGWMYIWGDGFNKDRSKGIRLLKRGEAEGNVLAMYFLGYCYDDGYGVDVDYSESVKFYQKAADAGLPCAINNLGNMYYDGEGVKEDEKKAFRLFLKAAERGSRTAMGNVGRRYKRGEGVKKNLEEAKKWFKKAADLGDEDAQKELGI